ncbi:MAG: hypothetical protein IJT91_06580 [Clostridia bacterium]|nr:hypothetical protein [Clostridia bacterium]
MKTRKNTRKTMARLLAGMISALMILTPLASFAEDPAVDAAEDVSYVSYDSASQVDQNYAWVIPVTSDVTLGDHISVPYDLPEYQPNPLEPVSAEVSQPFYFAPGEGIGTPAKDQGNFGTCWAFSVTAAAESSILQRKTTFNHGQIATPKTIDLSELSFAYFFYNTEYDPLGNMSDDRTAVCNMYFPEYGIVEEGETYLTRGGNNMFSTFAAMQWKGYVPESLAPYSSITNKYHHVDQMVGQHQAVHCRGAYWCNMNDINLVKQLIVQYGGVVISYNHHSDCYHPLWTSYYCSYKSYFNGHSVYICGWNDDFNSFFYKTPGKGAWIVKNSWGQNWGMQSEGAEGTYWMSYYDVNLREDVGVAFEFEDADNFDNNYQYDGTAVHEHITIPANPSDPTRLGNQFVVKASDYERLDAVSVALQSPNVYYSVQVYKKDAMETAPDAGTPMLTTPVTGRTGLTGCYTIPLNQELVFKRGDVYSVVISIWHDSGNAGVFVDMCYDNSWVQFTNSVGWGQSWFAWGQNAGWAELSRYVFPLKSDYKQGYTLRIKGYTNNVAPITYELTDITADGSDYARLNHPYSFTLATDATLPENIDVFMSGVLLTEGTSYTYDKTTGAVTINNVNGPISVNASANTHVHTWDNGVITTAPTCGATGIKTYTCTECGETTEEVVPATGRHTWDAGVITTEPTMTETGIRTYTCTVCGATREEEVPMIPAELTAEKAGSYDVKISGLDASKSYLIRYATGLYSSISAVKNGTNAGFVQVNGAYEATVTLPTDGVHTLSIQSGSESLYFGQISIDAADIRDHLVASTNELNLKVENLVGASYVKLFQGGSAVLTVASKNFSTDGLKTWADITVPASGSYIVRVVYTDGGMIEGEVTLEAPAASISSNGRVFVIGNYGGAGNVSHVRLAKGVYTSANEIKAASDLRTYGAKYFRTEDSAAIAALDAVNGTSTTYTAQVTYVSGYSEFITFDITPTVPSIATTNNSIILTNVQNYKYNIDWVRCAPGALTTLSQVRHTKGSQVKKAADIENERIIFSDLSAGTYTLYYLYDGWNLSEGLITVTIGPSPVLD